MSQFKFLHAADIHLDSPLKGLESYPDAPVEQIRNASRRALDNLIDLAIEQDVAFLLLAGDISDGDWKDYNTSLFFAQRMGRLREAGIKVFLVSGNHDAASVITKALRPPDNVYIFPYDRPKSIELENLDVVIHGQSYKSRDTKDDLAADYPLARSGLLNIGLLHTALTGRAGHESYAPTSPKTLISKGYDYWALGHIHQREVVNQQPWIVFPGNIQGRNIRETGPKGCTLIQVEEGRLVEVVHQDLDVLRWEQKKIDITKCSSLDELRVEIRKSMESSLDQSQGRTLAIRLILEGHTTLHNWLHSNYQHVCEECRAQAIGLGNIWLEKLQLETQPYHDPNQAFEENSALASLVRSIQSLSFGDDYMQEIPGLSELKESIPHEIVHEIEESFNLNNQDSLKQIQKDVQEILIGYLLRQGNAL